MGPEQDFASSIAHPKESRFQSAVDRITFPQFDDLEKILTRGVVPTFTAETIIMNNLLKTIDATGIASLSHQELLSYTTAIFTLGAFSLFSAGLATTMWYHASKNGKMYSEVLSMDKRAITNQSFVAQVFPELKQARFFGKLDLIGDINTSDEFPQDRTKVVREGFKGLYKLAVACQSNDDLVKDIDFFAGSSAISLAKLEKFGFTLRRDISRSSANIYDHMLLAPILIPVLLTYHKKHIQFAKGDDMVAVISRDQLVAHADFWKKIGHAE